MNPLVNMSMDTAILTLLAKVDKKALGKHVQTIASDVAEKVTTHTIAPPSQIDRYKRVQLVWRKRAHEPELPHYQPVLEGQ